MSPRSDDESFHQFVTRSTGSLTRLAYLLSGDQHLADDLVQNCLVRLYQAWPKVWAKDAAGAAHHKEVLRRALMRLPRASPHAASPRCAPPWTARASPRSRS